MNITINIDASFNSKNKHGGYAYWISTPDGAFKGSGYFRDNVLDSTDAEFKALVNALHCVVHKMSNVGIDIIWINTDSLNVINIIKGKIKNRIYVEAMAKYIKYITFIRPTKIIPRHVKAHLHKDTKRHWVNDWCDNMAKKQCKAKTRKHKKLSLVQN